MLNREEFIDWIEDNATPDRTHETWLISAASTVIYLALNGVDTEKSEIIEAIQMLSARIPLDVLSVASAHMVDVQRRILDESKNMN